MDAIKNHLVALNEWAAEDKQRSVIVIISESKPVDEEHHSLATTVGVCGQRNQLVEALQDAMRSNDASLASMIREASAKLLVEQILKKTNNE